MVNQLLDIFGLDVSFPSQHGITYAVQDVSITIEPGEVLGIVGESGAGKSTVGKCLLLIPYSKNEIEKSV